MLGPSWTSQRTRADRIFSGRKVVQGHSMSFAIVGGSVVAESDVDPALLRAILGYSVLKLLGR